MAKLSDLLNKQQDNGWISMAELDALEAAQRGQPIGQIPGSFGPGQGSFQRSGGNRVDLTPQGWQDTQTNEMMGPTSDRPNQDLPLDYANPLDYGGAKGYRIKGDSSRALLNDGRIVDLVPGRQEAMQRNQYAQQQAQAKQEAADLDLQLKRADLANKLSGGSDGKAPAGYRWTSNGNMEPVPGGPADMKAQAMSGLKAAGAADVDSAVASLRDAYNRLEQGGGITSTGKGAIDNMSAAASSSALGQVAGRMFGTQNQSARNDIAMTRPALLAALMKATGMSAKQMDSNAELKLWMTTATDPTLDVESNRRALDAIERKYLGQGGSMAGSAGQVSPKRQIEKGTIRNGYLYMGGDPNDQNSWKAAR